MRVANIATVDTAMAQKFKFLVFSFFCLPTLAFGQAQTTAPGGTAETALEGVDLKQKRGLTFLPGVRSTVAYSDNVGLNLNGAKQSGFRLEASPYVFASINNDQGTGQAYLSLRNFYQSAAPTGTYTGRIDFRGNGTANLYDRWLFLEGSGFAYNVNPLNFGAISFDAATVPSFDYRFQGFTLAPYLAGSWGTFADYKGQYSYGTSEVTGFTSQRQDQKLSGKVNSGSRFNTWGWSWDGNTQRRSTSGIPIVFNRNISTATIYGIPTQGLRLGAAVRYEQIDSLYNKSGKDNGLGPGVSLDWTPSTRTSVTGSAFKQYFGNTGQLGVSHRWERLSFNLSYDKSVISGNDASFLNINPQSLFSAGGYAATLNPIYRSLVADSLYSGFGVPIGLGVVNDALVLRNGGSVGLSYLLPSGYVSTTFSSVNRETLVRTFDPALGGLGIAGSNVALDGTFIGLVKTKAISIDLEHKLDSRSKWKAQLLFSDNDFPNLQRNVKRNSYQATYSTRLTTETTASFGLRRVEQTGSGFRSTNFDENSVFSTLDVRF
jgi:uncharacterized protein (PEP-CTERM system associated)